jgi:F-type H+-transporting ATPase subunit delta
MSAESIARRYAKAVFELSEEGVELGDALMRAAEVVGSEPAKVLLSPTCPSGVVKNVFAQVLSGQAGVDEVVRLAVLLAKRGKLSLLPEVASQFSDMVAAKSGKLDVAVTFAVEVSDSVRQALADSLSSSTGKKVNVSVSQDADIIGGMVVSVGDRKIDYSLKTKLEGLKLALTS